MKTDTEKPRFLIAWRAGYSTYEIADACGLILEDVNLVADFIIRYMPQNVYYSADPDDYAATFTDANYPSDYWDADETDCFAGLSEHQARAVVRVFGGDTTADIMDANCLTATTESKLMLTIKNLHKKQGLYVCGRCGAGNRLAVDHILPRSLYPEQIFNLDNYQILCKTCNSSKGNVDLTDHRSPEVRAMMREWVDGTRWMLSRRKYIVMGGFTLVGRRRYEKPRYRLHYGDEFEYCLDRWGVDIGLPDSYVDNDDWRPVLRRIKRLLRKAHKRDRYIFRG